MIRRIRVFHPMDDGSISTLVADNDLNSLFNHGEIFPLKNVRVGYWIYFLCLYFLMLEQEMLGNSLLNKAKGMVEARVLLWAVWICSKRECLAAISRLLIEST